MVKKLEINAGVAAFRAEARALLVDVRNDFEYAQGRIPGSRNLALSRILKEAEQELPEKDVPLYVYCLSGGRSARAAKLLELLGYESVTDIGGISDYTGPVEK